MQAGTLYQWYKLAVAYSAQYATTGYESVIINSTQFYFTTILQVNETYHGWSSAMHGWSSSATRNYNHVK